MKITYDYDIIRDYLFGIVDSQKAKEIAQLLKEDENARTIAEGILVMEKIFDGNEERINQYFDEVEKRHLSKINITGNEVRTFWLKIAASVIILMTLGVVGKYIFDSESAEEFVSREMMKPYPATTFRDQMQDELLLLAFTLYNEHNFKEAGNLFDKIIIDSPTATNLFYSGLSKLYSNQPLKAIDLFSSETLRSTLFQEQAEWFLAIAYMKAGDQSNAKKQLEIILANPAHYKSQEAKHLQNLLSE